MCTSLKEGQQAKTCFPQTPINGFGITTLKEIFRPLHPKSPEVSLCLNITLRWRSPAVEMQLHPRILRPWPWMLTAETPLVTTGQNSEAQAFFIPRATLPNCPPSTGSIKNSKHLSLLLLVRTLKLLL